MEDTNGFFPAFFLNNIKFVNVSFVMPSEIAE
jgi:hypothetical protein